jgi:hypothetical protein
MVSVDLYEKNVVIERVSFDYAISIDTEVGKFRIETPLSIHFVGQPSLTIDPESPGDDAITLLATLLHKTSVGAGYEASGRLIVKLQDGGQVEVPADPLYEAWSYSATDGELYVCKPGGEVEKWSARPGRSGTSE